MALRHCEFTPSSIILNICLVSQQLDAVREGFCFVSDRAPQVWSLLGVILFSSVSPLENSLIGTSFTLRKRYSFIQLLLGRDVKWSPRYRFPRPIIK